MQFILLGLLGAAAGVFSGLFGLGGAAVVVPALVVLFGFSQHSAQGTSLAMLLPPIGLLAVWRYWQAGYVNVGVAVVLAITFFVGAAVGAHFAVQVPQILMKRLFGSALAIIGILMIVSAR
ncbi:MAG: sulfite exporter TauE/SafE family protein [bacterium]